MEPLRLGPAGREALGNDRMGAWPGAIPGITPDSGHGRPWWRVPPITDGPHEESGDDPDEFDEGTEGDERTDDMG